jgi:hypothetical protein
MEGARAERGDTVARRKSMEKKAKQEFHELLDDLCRQEVFGSITLRFQKGDIVSVADSLEWKPSEIVEAYAAGKPPMRKIIIVKREQLSSGDATSE